MAQLILFNKPFDVLCQFTDDSGRPTLAHFLDQPETKGFYPAGRLDRDSEGLLLLTNDGRLQNRISDPQHKLPKTYWVQVEGLASESALDALRHGVTLKDGVTLPAKVRAIPEPSLWARRPPVRIRQSIPTSWLELTITEGKNRQIRRMTAAVGLPTLRLVRASVGPWQLSPLAPGQFAFNEVHLPPPAAKSAKAPQRRRK